MQSPVLQKITVTLFTCLFWITYNGFSKEIYRPNIINIVVDDMGYSDLGHFGGEIKTPNIDGLAKDGATFTNYKTYPKCFPTRNSMLSGLNSDPISYRRDAVTIAEVLKSVDYECYFVGKTHGELLNDMKAVTESGFDRSFGNQSGGNYFDESVQQCYLDGKAWKSSKPFYKTDAQTDFAIEFINESVDKNKPFFMQLAYHAPHYPVQAKPEDIEKYKKVYLTKPQKLRERRYLNLINSGLLSKDIKLTPEIDQNQEWEKLSQEDKEKYATVMATHAAMIDNVDQNIGRLINTLKELKIFENTLITFTSDNGATPENGNGLWPGTINSRMGKDYDKNAEIGSENSHWQIGYVWANVCNTPWREYKNNCHEGGLSSPLIVHWPKYIKKPIISKEKVYVWDFMPTWLKVSGAEYPQNYKNRAVKPLIGENFLPLLLGNKAKNQERIALFYYQKRRALTFIKGDWKIVTDQYSMDNTTWELYNLKEDRAEMNDLASENSEVLSLMINDFNNYLNKITDPNKFNAALADKTKSKKKKKNKKKKGSS